MQITVSGPDGQIEAAFAGMRAPIATAATAAMGAVVKEAVKQGRANIAAAGFSSAWQNALRARVFPSSGASVNAAGLVYHKIPYAGDFETGITITGRPVLWLPLPDAPRGAGGHALKPSQAAQLYGGLVSINHPGRPPLLASRPRRRGDKPVPLYVGVPAVQEKALFGIEGAVEQAASRFGEFYDANLKV